MQKKKKNWYFIAYTYSLIYDIIMKMILFLLKEKRIRGGH